MSETFSGSHDEYPKRLAVAAAIGVFALASCDSSSTSSSHDVPTVTSPHNTSEHERPRIVVCQLSSEGEPVRVAVDIDTFNPASQSKDLSNC